MSKWDARFLSMAGLVASWSKDPSTQVGAVITDLRNRVISLGFNGFPRDVDDDFTLLADRDEKLRRTIHAEENALLFANRSVEGCTLYVTHPPCARCTAKLIQAGIARIVTVSPAGAFAERWKEDLDSSRAMMGEAGVVFVFGEP
jgi:dCMP deaminase